MDMDKLLEALDDERNDELLQFTTKKIQEMNWKILRELQLPVKDTKDLFHKLQNFLTCLGDSFCLVFLQVVCLELMVSC